MSEPEKKQKTSSMQVKVAAEHATAKGVYSNVARLFASKEEVQIDFYSFNFVERQATLTSRVFLNPEHAKRLYQHLGQLLKAHASTPDSAQQGSTQEIGFNVE